jgi:hypothetical protein
VAFDCFFTNENTGRRLCSGGGELCCTGDDGGLDLGASSDQIAAEVFGLDVGGSEESHVGFEQLIGANISALRCSALLLSRVRSTRLRLIGGSSS